MIELKNLTKKYDFTVLKSVNLKFIKNNIYVIKGISGSGKTTLLNIISGLDLNYEGKCLIDNIDLKDFSKKDFENYRSNINIMLQKTQFYKKNTILENLIFINDDLNKIYRLSSLFGIEKLLTKKPNELSGGERQRVSLIKTLLNEGEILILDEATSNLDLENSLVFVEYLKKINKTNKIIIIATHKDIYDCFANQIIQIDLGETKIIKNNLSKPLKSNIDKKQNFHRPKIFQLAIKNKIHLSWWLQTFLVFLICLLFLSFSFKANFRHEYVKRNSNTFSYDVIDISPSDTYFQNEIIYTYDNYFYEEDKKIAYPLLKKEDSNLRNLIDVGSFPTKNNEVLINKEYADIYFKDVSYENILNYSITLHQNNFKISGIIGLKEENLSYLYATNSYYKNIVSRNGVKPAIFMPYETITKIGTPKQSDSPMTKINKEYILNIYMNKNFDKNTILSNAYDLYQNKINEISVEVNSQSNIAIFSSITLLILTIIFFINQISMELHYRQKEIGYLKLSHFSNTNITNFITLEYMTSFIILIILSILCYLVVSYLIFKFYNYYLFLDIYHLLLILFSLILSFYSIIILSLNKYLKKDIICLLQR